MMITLQYLMSESTILIRGFSQRTKPSWHADAPQGWPSWCHQSVSMAMQQEPIYWRYLLDIKIKYKASEPHKVWLKMVLTYRSSILVSWISPDLRGSNFRPISGCYGTNHFHQIWQCHTLYSIAPSCAKLSTPAKQPESGRIWKL